MKPYYSDDTVTLHHGDALAVARELPAGAADCIVTSPPYFGLRDYGVEASDWPAVSYAPMLGVPPVDVPGMSCALGLEPSPLAYVAHLVLLFAEMRRVLADDGTLWLNIGDSYYSGRGNPGPNSTDEKQRARRGWVRPQDRCGVDWSSPKNQLGIPWRVAFALQADGWILRNDVIWSKPNAMPESVNDRLSGRYEHVFLFSKSRRYWFDLAAIGVPTTTQRESALNWARDTKEGEMPGQHRQHRVDRTPYGPGMRPQNLKAATGRRHELPPDHPGTRNPGDVWTIPTQPFPGAHFATMPPALAERCIAAGCKPGGTVLDPFSGSGTTGLAAQRLGRRYIGIDLKADYLDLSLRTRLRDAALDFGDGAS